MTKGMKIFFIVAIIFISGCGTSAKENIELNSIIIPTKSEIDAEAQQDEDKKINVIKDSDTIDNRPFVMFEGCPQREIDIISFQAINKSYAKDKNGIYWLGRPGCDLFKLPDADLATFVALNNFFVKDKSFAYTGDRKLEGVDIKTFKIVEVPNIPEGACAGDKNRYYSAWFLSEDEQGNPLDNKCARIKE